MEKVVETKTCKHCNISFGITDKDLEFYEKISPVFAGKKYSIPSPTLCPECREQRRVSFGNVRGLYKRKESLEGKEIVSMYSPDKEYTVYTQDIWWGDSWDARDYKQDWNSGQSFLEQIASLVRVVPKISLSTEKLENSHYVNYCGRIKDSYLMFLAAYNENCLYSQSLRYSKYSVDCLCCQYLENCYEVVDSWRCYGCFYCHYIQDCRDCYYSQDLIGCQNCIFCSGISGKQNYFLNVPISPPEFEVIQQKLQSDSEFFEQTKKKFDDIVASQPKKYSRNIGSENVVGEYITNSQNIQRGFDISLSQDCKYVGWVFESKNCYDVYDWGETAENCYECYKVGKGVSNLAFCAYCLENISRCYYCYDCVNNCRDCFGCVGLKNAQYCILNKQYTKEEYEKLVPQIIEHMMKPHPTPLLKGEGEIEWGEFFPSSMSPFGYNETVAMEYYPLTREEVLSNSPHSSSHPPQGGGTGGSFLRGPIFNWSDYETPFPKVDKIIPASKLPPDITDIPDDILNWAIECEDTRKPFRIIKQELEFYRKHNLPIPKKHPDQRHKLRMQQRNPRKLFNRTCDKCHTDIQTTYSPERPETIYCESCYNAEVY